MSERASERGSQQEQASEQESKKADDEGVPPLQNSLVASLVLEVGLGLHVHHDLLVFRVAEDEVGVGKRATSLS